MILGDGEAFKWMDGARKSGDDGWDGDVAALLAEADALDAEALIAARLEDFYSDGDEDEEYDPSSEPDFALDFDAGELEVFDAPTVMESYFAERKGPIFLATLPTKEGADAPAHLNFGGWNDCPFPHEHVALLRRWRREYGAELVTLAHDVVELRPTAFVRDPEAAKRLARELFAYSSDNVTQGTESVRALAQWLLGAEMWFSWWD